MGAEIDGVPDRGEDGREEGVLHEVHEFRADHGEEELEVGGDVWLVALIVQEGYDLYAGASVSRPVVDPGE